MTDDTLTFNLIPTLGKKKAGGDVVSLRPAWTT